MASEREAERSSDEFNSFSLSLSMGHNRVFSYLSDVLSFIFGLCLKLGRKTSVQAFYLSHFSSPSIFQPGQQIGCEKSQKKITQARPKDKRETAIWDGETSNRQTILLENEEPMAERTEKGWLRPCSPSAQQLGSE